MIHRTETTHPDGTVEIEEHELPDPEPVVLPLATEIDAARTSLAAATTVTQTKTRSLALDGLREAQLAALLNPTPEVNP